jgi:photosynthetic reaction center M subunit
MSAYQNLFTQIQVQGHPETGPAGAEGDDWRVGKPFFVHLLGRIGNAQIGPMHLGWTGILSLFTGFLAFEIIGLNMFASVGWNPAEFVRQLPWLAL